MSFLPNNYPPYYSPGPTAPQNDPSFTRTPTPQIQYGPIQTGEFILSVTQSTVIDVGTTARFSITFQHVIDGAIDPVGVALKILDGNGNAMGSNYGVIIGTVTDDPSIDGGFFATVQFLASMPPGNYSTSWSGTYTPVNTQEPNVSLPINSPHLPFSVRNLKSPSQFYLIRTDNI